MVIPLRTSTPTTLPGFPGMTSFLLGHPPALGMYPVPPPPTTLIKKGQEVVCARMGLGQKWMMQRARQGTVP